MTNSLTKHCLSLDEIPSSGRKSNDETLSVENYNWPIIFFGSFHLCWQYGTAAAAAAA